MSIDIGSDTRNFLTMLRKKIHVRKNSYSNKVLISGMGGSGISGRIMETLAAYEDIGQVFSWNNYGIPAWMTSNDNVICISYSGNTAETLSAAKKAREIGCQIEIITTGGKLGSLADEHNWNKTIIGKGSAIFIHLTKNYGPTKGCIALKKNDLLILLKIINKKSKIKIC